MNDINFMAIDPSKRSTGIFIKYQNRTHLFTIKFKSKIPNNEIFILFSERIGKLLKIYEIELIIHEGIPLGISKKHTIPTRNLNEMLGLIKLEAYKNKIRHIIPVNQSLWKGILKGYPFLNKPKNKKYIEQATIYLKQSFATSDEVDAYCIGLAMYRIYMGTTWTDAQTKMKNKIISIYNEIKLNKIF